MRHQTCLFRRPGDGVCATGTRHLYQFLMKDAIDSSRSKSLREKIPGLGKKSHVPPGPWQKSKVQGNVSAATLSPWCLTCGTPMLLGRNIVDAIDQLL